MPAVAALKVAGGPLNPARCAIDCMTRLATAWNGESSAPKVVITESPAIGFQLEARGIKLQYILQLERSTLCKWFLESVKTKTMS